MIKIGKWYHFVDADQLDTTMQDNDLAIEGLETEKAQLQKIAAQVPELQEQIKELEKEVLQLQKSTFVPLSPTDDTPAKVPAVKRNGGRKKAVTQ